MEEVQWYFPIVVRGNVKNHVPPIDPIVSDGWKGGPLNRNMWHVDLWNVIHPRNSKQCIDVLFCYFELFYLVVAQPISVLLSFPLHVRCDAIQSIIRYCDRINNRQQRIWQGAAKLISTPPSRTNLSQMGNKPQYLRIVIHSSHCNHKYK